MNEFPIHRRLRGPEGASRANCAYLLSEVVIPRFGILYRYRRFVRSIFFLFLVLRHNWDRACFTAKYSYERFHNY